MSEKSRLACAWCASCGGCEEAIVDLGPALLDLLDRADFAFFPALADFRREDIEGVPDGALLAALITGSVISADDEEMVRLLRRKSRCVIAMGSCAHMGGVPALANQLPEDAWPGAARPAPAARAAGEPPLPELRPPVRTVGQVVEVDGVIPGCPPSSGLVRDALERLLAGRAPSGGEVMAPDVALCEECPRRESAAAEWSFAGFRRPHVTELDPTVCFLNQGVLCMGPATRAGCESACIRGNMPCTGCYGPTSRVHDQGAKMIACIASAVKADTPEEVDAVLDGLPDTVGAFYRYGLAASLLPPRSAIGVGEISSV